MSDREKFEAWCLDEGIGIDKSPLTGVYVSPAARVAWRAWQASHQATLEKAALFMESRALALQNGTHIGDTMARIYRDEADSIRALANGDKS